MNEKHNFPGCAAVWFRPSIIFPDLRHHMIIRFSITTLITFFMFGIDKQSTVNHKRRIPEAYLLTFTFIGGTAGAILGKLAFRHKISKKSFLLKTGWVVLIQVVMLYFLSRDFLGRL